jgi:predicted RND superfamily exporter protein
MADMRHNIERQFEAFAGAICRFWFATLIVSLLVFGLLASGVAKLTIDTSNESFLRPSDPILTRYYEFKDQFGREDAIIIAVEPGQVFDLDALEKIKALHDDLVESTPHLDDVTSLINARETVGQGDALIVGDLMENWPEDDAALEDLRARVLANPLYQNQLISSDGGLTTIVITLNAFSTASDLSTDDVLAAFDEADTGADTEPTLLTDQETKEAVASIIETVDLHQGEDFKLYVAGMPIVTESLKAALQADMRQFMAMAIAAIAICLFLMFQRISGAVLPLVVVVMTLISTMGLMGHVGVAVKVPTVILPSFLLAVGVGASVHVLAIFFQQLQGGADKHDAIIYAMGHSGLAIVLTSLTTAVGLGSFATAEVAPIGDLGLFAGIGTLISLAFTIVLLPAMLAIVPVRRPKSAQVHTNFFDRILAWVADVSVRRAKVVVAFFLVALVAFGISASQLRFTHDVLEWLPEDWTIRQATQVIDTKMKGSVVVEMVVDTGRENGIYDPDFLNRIDALAIQTTAYEAPDLSVGKVFSVVDILKEIHKALNENRDEFYVVPQNADLIPQEFLLFENSGSDDLETVIDSRFQLLRVSIRVPWRDAFVFVPFLDQTTAQFEAVLGDDAQVQATGMLTILVRTLSAAMSSMAKSYLVAFLAITAMMMALVGSIKYGALAMIPNLTPIVIVMGAMIWLNFPLNMFTMLVGSIAIGLAVDDTVHFMHNFRRYYGQSGDLSAAVHETLHTTGRAMLVTSIVLGAGFYIFAFASMNNVIHFGILTGSAILLALVANFFMLPALLAMTTPHKQEATI